MTGTTVRRALLRRALPRLGLPRLGLRAVSLLSVLIALGACIPPRVATPAPSVPPTPPTSAVPSGSVATTSPPAPAGVQVDPSLLTVLPDAVVGVPLVEDAETAAEIAAEGSIAPFVASIALARAFAPTATDAGTDYLVVTVVRLRPGTFGDFFYRQWRDTFDSGVCQQAGGVDGHAEADIAGHHTYIGTCAGGVHTYHVYLPGSDVLVSAQGAGDGRFGERLVETLTE